MRTRTQLLSLVLILPIFVFAVLALAQLGSGSSCAWQFPKWFGCVMAAHENLAGGLIGAAGVLLAAWVAWQSVQQQINTERERMLADRVEAEQLLSSDLTAYAEGMAAAWRLLDALPEGVDRKKAWPTFQAAAYMAERLSRPESLANYRSMAEILGWDRRRRYAMLVSGLHELKDFSDWEALDPGKLLDVIRKLADDFEYCLPNTSQYFDGLWRRSAKAMTFAEYVEHIGTFYVGELDEAEVDTDRSSSPEGARSA